MFNSLVLLESLGLSQHRELATLTHNLGPALVSVLYGSVEAAAALWSPLTRHRATPVDETAATIDRTPSPPTAHHHHRLQRLNRPLAPSAIHRQHRPFTSDTVSTDRTPPASSAPATHRQHRLPNRHRQTSPPVTDTTVTTTGSTSVVRPPGHHTACWAPYIMGRRLQGYSCGCGLDVYSLSQNILNNTASENT